MPDGKLTLEVSRVGRSGPLQLSINRRGADGTGDGYRIAGPSFNGISEVLLRRELSEDDAREIRAYLDKAFPSEGEREAAELSRRIADLRLFEREYRSRLDAYLSSQLKDLRGSDIPND